jgi:hypothetical protein
METEFGINMAGFVEYITKGFGLFGKNILSFIGAMLLVIIATIVLVIIGGVLTMFVPILGAILLLLFMLAILPLSASVYGMALEAAKTEKTKIGTMIDTFKEKWPTLLGIEVVTVIIVVLPLLIAMLFTVPMAVMSAFSQNSSASAFTNLASIPILLFAIIVMFIISIFFCLAVPAAVLEGTGVLDSIKLGISVAKSRFLSLFAVVFVFAIISAAVGWIPVIGALIAAFLISPAQAIALMLFYMDSKPKK